MNQLNLSCNAILAVAQHSYCLNWLSHCVVLAILCDGCECFERWKILHLNTTLYSEGALQSKLAQKGIMTKSQGSVVF